MASIFSLVFFFILLILSIAGLIFSILLSRATKGATKAWQYLAIFGGTNAILGILGLIRNFAADWFLQLVFALQSVCILVIATFAVLSATTFVKDFGIKQSYLTARNVLTFLVLLFIVVLAYNINNFNAYWFQTIYSISILILTLSYLLMLLPLGKLSIKTKKAPWFILLAGFFFDFLLIISLLGGHCCKISQLLAGKLSAHCAKDMVFVNILPLPCIPQLVALYKIGLLSVALASILIVIAIGMFWYRIARPGIAK